MGGGGGLRNVALVILTGDLSKNQGQNYLKIYLSICIICIKYSYIHQK